MKMAETNSLQYQIGDKRIRGIVEECLRSVKEWGLQPKHKVYWKLEIMDSFGRCSWTKGASGEPIIIISLNKGLTTQAADVVRDTVFHELAHAAVDFESGHGGKWKKAIRIIRKHTHLPLRVKGNVEDVTEAYWLNGYKYVLKCQKCGQTVGFNTMMPIIEHPDEWDDKHNCRRFTHKGCGGPWKRIK